MAEGGSLHREAIATVQLTYSSENPILVDYIKEEPEEESESEVLNLLVVEQPPLPLHHNLHRPSIYQQLIKFRQG